MRLISISSYVRNGTVFFAGVFQQGAEEQRYFGSMGWNDFTRNIDTGLANDFILSDLTVYTLSGEEYYLGVWRHTTGAGLQGFWVSDWNSFAKQVELYGARGLQLSAVREWSFGGQRRYAGVWHQRSGRHEVIAATDEGVFRRKADALALGASILEPKVLWTEFDYQPPVGLAAAFHDRLDPIAVGTATQSAKLAC